MEGKWPSSRAIIDLEIAKMDINKKVEMDRKHFGWKNQKEQSYGSQKIRGKLGEQGIVI